MVQSIASRNFSGRLTQTLEAAASSHQQRDVETQLIISPPQLTETSDRLNRGERWRLRPYSRRL
jgi:hypothetical protein